MGALETRVGDEIRRHRTRMKLSQDELAELVGVSRNQINSQETGKTLPGLGVAIRLAEVFGITLQDLTAGEESMGVRLERLERRLEELTERIERLQPPSS